MLAPLARSWRLAMFDRDSTINVDTGHLHEPEKLELIPSTVDIMRCYFEDPEYKLVVTNQEDIAKGLYTEADMRNLHRCMEDELEKLGVYVDAWCFCLHHPDYTGACVCRKASPGMLLAAMRDFERECGRLRMLANVLRLLNRILFACDIGIGARIGPSCSFYHAGLGVRNPC